MASQPLELLVWNVRGLNSPARRNAIFQVATAANPSIVCLQETKLEVVTSEIIRHCLGNKFEKFFYLSASGTRGGVLIAWDPIVVALSNPHTTDNTLTALVTPVDGGDRRWWLTRVYGPQGDAEKVQFLQEIADVRDLHAGPWALVGDFNLIVNPEDKNNTSINRRMMVR